MKALDQFTINDWIKAQRDYSAGAFSRMRRLALKSGIELPAFVAGANMRPRITFDFNQEMTDRYARVMQTDRLNAFNKAVADWGMEVEAALRSNVAALVRFHGKDQRLQENVHSYIAMDKQYHAEVYRVGFRFSRHGVHLHYGAGTGIGGEKGSKWLDRLGRRHETDKESLGKLGTGNRRAVDWFNPVLEQYLPKLADIAADYCADMTLNTSYLYLS